MQQVISLTIVLVMVHGLLKTVGVQIPVKMVTFMFHIMIKHSHGTVCHILFSMTLSDMIVSISMITQIMLCETPAAIFHGIKILTLVLKTKN